MLKKLTCFTTITACIIFNPAQANLDGANVAVQNTIQAPFTGGIEENFVNANTTVSLDTTELPGFGEIYDIDITDNSISFTWIDTAFSQSISGPIEADLFDRNYFEFDLPTDTVITEITFDDVTSELLPGSTLPSAQLISPNQVVTIFDEGVIRELGFNPSFNITTSEVPLPMSLHFMLMGLATIGASRFKKVFSIKNKLAYNRRFINILSV